MKSRDFYLGLAATVVLSVSAVLTVLSSIEFKAFIAAAELFAAYIILEKSKAGSRKTGRTDAMKISVSSTEILYELIALAGVMLVATVPKPLAVAVLGLVAFTELVQRDVVRKLKSSYRLDIGRNGRIGVLAASLIASGFNDYYIFYGVIVVGAVTLYDLLKMVRHIHSEFF